MATVADRSITTTPAPLYPTAETSMLDAATMYYAAGIAPIRLYGIGADGRCACGNADCPEKSWGKHPVGDKWQHAARNTHPGSIYRDFYAWKGNIGCYLDNRFVLLDADGAEGMATFAAMADELPPTFGQASGSGTGAHRVYRLAEHHDPQTVTDRNKVLPGVDVKLRGQFVGAPSMHRSGARYAITHALPIAILPDALYEKIKKRVRVAAPARTSVPTTIARGDLLDRAHRYMAKLPDAIDGSGSGSLNTFAAARAAVGWMRKGLSKGDAWGLLLDYNATKCHGPWSEKELVHKWEDAESATTIPVIEDRPAPARTARARHQTPHNTVTGELDVPEDDAKEPEVETAEPMPPPVAPANDAQHDAPGPPSAPTRRRDFNCTDTGNAERFAALHQDLARFVPEWGTWIVYDGKRWVEDPGNVRVGALAKVTARSIYEEARNAEDADARAKLVKWAVASEFKKGRESTIALARSEPGMAAQHTSLDVDPFTFNVMNGTLDLRSGTLRQHAAADMLTKISTVTYDAQAECPRFVRFLGEIMGGDLERVEFLRRFLGYSLTGDVREHALCFWYGRTGGNGKSTLAALLFHLLGDYAIKAAPDLLFRSEKTERHPTELADLFGIRLVVCNETAQNRAWDEATVKDVTGGDPIRARRMRENFWTFRPSHKLVVFGNNKPRLADADDGGMKRRLRLVPFEVSFTANPDRTLDAALRAEAPGILRYLVEGCLAWQREGLTEPAVMVEATAGYFAEEDTVGRFLADRCELVPGAKVTRKALRDANAAWAEEAGERPAHPKALAKSLQGRGVTTGKVRDANGPRDGWIGVRLRDDAFASRGPQCDMPS
jgi:P4 family phage/plasmid primase-like protien